jgi:cytochrome c biogenesis protein CcdA
MRNEVWGKGESVHAKSRRHRSPTNVTCDTRPGSITRKAKQAIRTLALRLTTTVFIINATATWLILTMPDFPQLLAVFHGILAIIMLMRIAMILKGGVTKT